MKSGEPWQLAGSDLDAFSHWKTPFTLQTNLRDRCGRTLSGNLEQGHVTDDARLTNHVRGVGILSAA